MLAERTINKIKIFGDDFLEELLQDIDVQDLPQFLGGNCSCSLGCLQSDQGPWMQNENIIEQHQKPLRLTVNSSKEIPIQKLVDNKDEEQVKGQNNQSDLEQTIERFIRFINLNSDNSES